MRGFPPQTAEGDHFTSDVLIRTEVGTAEYVIGYYVFTLKCWYVYDRYDTHKTKYDSVYEWWPLPAPHTGVKDASSSAV